jgi:hypothetical protein
MPRRRRTAAQEGRSLILNLIIGVLFLLIMINVVLPWAGRTLADNYRDQITNAASPSVDP